MGRQNKPKAAITDDEIFVINRIVAEYKRASSLHPALNSSHEGYAVIKEELDELWEEVRKKREKRSGIRMAKEATQVGAMAMRFILDLCLVRNVHGHTNTRV